MKYKTTERAIRNNYYYVVKVGYCDLQTLLRYRSPNSYTCNRDGWKADFYEIKPNMIISTGYAPIGNSYLDYNRIRHYEELARHIANNWDIGYEEQTRKLDVLIDQFASEIYEKDPMF